MKRNKIWGAILSVSILLTSCAAAFSSGGSADSVAMEKRGGAPMAAEAPMAEMAEEAYFDEEMAADSSFSTDGAAPERIVIKNANISIVVKEPSTAMEAIVQMAEDMGGFVVFSNLYKTTTSQGLEVPNANLTVRVPAEKLEEALEEIKSLVEDPQIDILNEDVSGQDVTSEVTDLESRLRNLEAAETQLLKIMENATETEDVITVFRELTSVREEIEVIEGQIKYYRESAALSAISVFIQAKAAIEPITIGGWKPGVEAQRALQALVNGAQTIVDVLIWLILFALPILAIIGVPIYLVFRWIRKRRKNKIQKDKPTEKKVS